MRWVHRGPRKNTVYLYESAWLSIIETMKVALDCGLFIVVVFEGIVGAREHTDSELVADSYSRAKGSFCQEDWHFP